MRHSRRQRGVALILVIWTFAVLAVLGAEIGRAMRDDALSTRNFKQETFGRYIAIAAVNEAILAIQARRITGDTEERGADEQYVEDPTELLSRADGQWVRGEFEGWPYEVRATDEGSKLGLNAVDRDVIEEIMLNLGYDQREAETVADSIHDWRDEDDLHGINGAEDDYYDGLPRPYQCKDAPFDSVDELLKVRGVTWEMYWGWGEVPGLREIFSVDNRQGRINLRSVSPAVMRALTGIESEEASEFQTQRNQNGGEVPIALQDLLADTGVNARESVPTEMTIEARTFLPPRRGEDGLAEEIVGDDANVLAQLGVTIRIPNNGRELRVYKWYDSIFDEYTEAAEDDEGFQDE